jgi:hypothetical protein
VASFSRLGICRTGSFDRFKNAKMLKPPADGDYCAPLSGRFVPADPFGEIATPGRGIVGVLLPCRFPQIGEAIVASVTVDVINLRRWPAAINV